jgi:hypothetical protein
MTIIYFSNLQARKLINLYKNNQYFQRFSKIIFWPLKNVGGVVTGVRGMPIN